MAAVAPTDGSVADLLERLARSRDLAAGTMIGTGTISNADLATGFACLMEARLVEQVEKGAAQTPFLRFGDRVKIEMRDAEGASVFGAIEQVVEPYSHSREDGNPGLGPRRSLPSSDSVGGGDDKHS